MSTPSDPALAATVVDELARYFEHLAARVDRAVRAVPAEKLYVKPFAFGNSVGHLVLHLTGNLNYYIGAKVAGSGYVRDRPREFTEPSPPPGPEALGRFREAVGLVVETLRGLDAPSLMVPVAGEDPARTRFGLFLVCAAHLNNHVGQLAYLVRALGHSTDEPPLW